MFSGDAEVRTRTWLFALAAVALSLGACNDPGRVFDVLRPPDNGPPAPPPPPVSDPVLGEFPPVAPDADVFVGAESIYEAIASYHGGKLASRFVLFPGGSFALQFLSPRFSFFEYRGWYTRTEGSRVRLDWEGWSTAGKWEAAATLEGDQLIVAYNLVMSMSDFYDGVYVRAGNRTTK